MCVCLCVEVRVESIREEGEGVGGGKVRPGQTNTLLTIHHEVAHV